MKASFLYKLSYIYLLLSPMIFLITWLNVGFALILAIVMGGSYYKALMATNEVDENLFFEKELLYGLTVIAFIWCFCAGIGYFYYQSFDYHFRNAVFRDLINYEWPVFYNNADTPLVYYIGYWLVVAVFAKLSTLLGANAYVSFMTGNVFLLLYAIVGVILIFLHIIKACKVDSKKSAIFAIILFIFFSGMDIIGFKFFSIMGPPFKYHIEWWANFVQYSSLTTSMFWVFNQFIPTALIMLLVFNERNVKNFGVLVATSLFYAPYPTAGIGFIMQTYAISCFAQSINKKEFLVKEIFTLQNVGGVFLFLPVLILYYITNSEGMGGYFYLFDFTTVSRYLLFLVLEFLLIVLVIGKRYYKDVFFVTLVVGLIFIPFLRVDQQNNFCMRAPIGLFVLLAVYSIRFLLESFKEKKDKVLSIILSVLLLIGAVTPMYEFYRGFYNIKEAKKFDLVQDKIYTLNSYYIKMPIFGYDVNHQYTAKTYKTDIFWQILAKKHTN